jgi:HEAT repeat protein
MFFKPKAQKLVEAWEQATQEGSPMDMLARRRKAAATLEAFGARHPQELLPFLSEEMAPYIGKWISGSGATGIALLKEIVLGNDPLRASWALRSLWEFEERAEIEIPWLIQLLEHPDETMRWSAAHCLGRIGPAAVSAGSQLGRVAMEGSVREKTSAFYALKETGYDPAIVAEICFDALNDEDAAVSAAALSTLKAIQADPNRAFDWIVKNLQGNEGNRLESDAIDLLEKCDLTAGRSPRAIAALESFVAKDPPNRQKAMSALWRLDPLNKTLFEKLEMDLRSDESEMESACDILCEMKAAGAPFVDLLIQQLQKHQEYWDFCWAAVDALGEIGPAAAKAKPLLKTMTTHPSELVQARSIEALKKLSES